MSSPQSIATEQSSRGDRAPINPWFAMARSASTVATPLTLARSATCRRYGFERGNQGAQGDWRRLGNAVRNAAILTAQDGRGDNLEV
jgi:hypothetical protein